MRRVWPLSYRVRVVANGASGAYWAVAYPTPQGGFIVEVFNPDRGGRFSYFIDSLSEVAEAVRQAVIDFNALAGRPIGSIAVEVVEVLNSYVTYVNEAVGRLAPLNDVYIADVANT